MKRHGWGWRAKGRRSGRARVLAVSVLMAVLLLVPQTVMGAERVVLSQNAVLSENASAVPGDSRRVYDQAGLFSEDEQEQLEEDIQSFRESTGMDAAVVTTENAEGKTSEQYADDFYDNMGFGTGEDLDGVLYLMDMDNRELYISTSGGMIRYLTDERIEDLLDHGIGYMQDGDYASCARQMIRDTGEWYRKGIVRGQYNEDRDTGKISPYGAERKRSIRWYEALLAVGVSVFCAGAMCSGVKREYAMERERGRAAGYHMAYRADAGFCFRNRQDVLSNSHITRQMIPRNTHSSGGSPGHSGRSTTHHSSSGRSHGGGGRKF